MEGCGEVCVFLSWGVHLPPNKHAHGAVLTVSWVAVPVAAELLGGRGNACGCESANGECDRSWKHM